MVSMENPWENKKNKEYKTPKAGRRNNGYEFNTPIYYKVPKNHPESRDGKRYFGEEVFVKKNLELKDLPPNEFLDSITSCFENWNEVDRVDESSNIYPILEELTNRYGKSLVDERNIKSVFAFENISRIIGYDKVLSLIRLASSYGWNKERLMGRINLYLNEKDDIDKNSDPGIRFLNDVLQTTDPEPVIEDHQDNIDLALEQFVRSREDYTNAALIYRKKTLGPVVNQSLKLKALDSPESAIIEPIDKHYREKAALESEKNNKLLGWRKSKLEFKKSVNNYFQFILSLFGQLDNTIIDDSSQIKKDLALIANISNSSSLLEFPETLSIKAILSYLNTLINIEIDRRKPKNLKEILRLNYRLIDRLISYSINRGNTEYLIIKQPSNPTTETVESKVNLLNERQVRDLYSKYREKRQIKTELIQVAEKELVKLIGKLDEVFDNNRFNNGSLNLLRDVDLLLKYSKESPLEDLDWVKYELIRLRKKYFEKLLKYEQRIGFLGENRNKLEAVIKKDDERNYDKLISELLKRRNLTYQDDGQDFLDDLNRILDRVIYNDSSAEKKDTKKKPNFTAIIIALTVAAIFGVKQTTSTIDVTELDTQNQNTSIFNNDYIDYANSSSAGSLMFSRSGSNNQTEDNTIIESHSLDGGDQPDFYISNGDLSLIKNQINEVQLSVEYDNGETIPTIEMKENIEVTNILNHTPNNSTDGDYYNENISADLYVEYSVNTLTHAGDFLKLSIPENHFPKYIISKKGFYPDARIVSVQEDVSDDKDFYKNNGYTILIRREDVGDFEGVIRVGYLREDKINTPDAFKVIGDNVNRDLINESDKIEIDKIIQNLFAISSPDSGNIQQEIQLNSNTNYLKQGIKNLSNKYLNQIIDENEFAKSLTELLKSRTRYGFNNGITDYRDIQLSVRETIEQIDKGGGIICNQSSILLAYLLEVHGIQTSLKAIIINEDNDTSREGNQISSRNYHVVVQIKTNRGKIVEFDPTANSNTDGGDNEFEAPDSTENQNKSYEPDNSNIIWISLGGILFGASGGIIYWCKKTKNNQKNKEPIEAPVVLEPETVKDSQTTFYRTQHIPTTHHQNLPPIEESITQNSFRSNWRDKSIESNFLRVATIDQQTINILADIDLNGINHVNSYNLYSKLSNLAGIYKIFNQETQIHNFGRDNIKLEKGYLLDQNLMHVDIGGKPAVIEIPEIENEEYLIEKLLHAINKINEMIDDGDLQIKRQGIDFIYESPDKFFTRLLSLLNN